MINYNKLACSLKRKINNYSEKISKSLSRPKYKFIYQMLYGLAESQSVHLSNISRALKESVTLKKTIERLSRNLNCFNENEIVMENYTQLISEYIDNHTIFPIDLSDVSKPCSFRLEDLGKVHDGSKNTIEKGYNMFEIAALTRNFKMPMPAYTRIYSNTEREFVSQDEEALKGFRYLTKHYGRMGIRTLDRGYDANIYYRYFINNKEKFVIRSKINRHVIFDGKKINILDLANKYKGKYKMKFKNKEGKTINCKISYIPISLPFAHKKELTLAVVYGFGKKPMLLISNLKSDDKRLSVVITKVYLLRWRIEEYFKFKKQQFDFENFRVRSLNSIRALNTLVTMLIGLISIMSECQNKSILVN